MKHFLVLYIIALLWPAPLPAQREKDTLAPPMAPSNLYLKTNLFSLAEPEEAVTLSVEYRLNINTAVQLEGGYIFRDNTGNTNYLVHSGGYRFKPELRFYTRGKPSMRYHYMNYWAVEAVIKGVTDEKSEFVGRLCGLGGCAYDQKMTWHVNREVWGIGGKAGRETYLDPRAKRIILDIYAGAGVRYRRVLNDLPPDAKNLESPRFFEINTGPVFYPYIILGIKAGVRVK